MTTPTNKIRKLINKTKKETEELENEYLKLNCPKIMQSALLGKYYWVSKVTKDGMMVNQRDINDTVLLLKDEARLLALQKCLEIVQEKKR